MIVTRVGEICHVISLLRQFPPFPKGIWGLGSNPGNRMSGLCAEQFAVRKCLHLFSTDWKSGCGHLAVVFGETAARNIQQLVETWGKQCNKTPFLRIGCCFLLSWSFGDCFPTLDRGLSMTQYRNTACNRESIQHGITWRFPAIPLDVWFFLRKIVIYTRSYKFFAGELGIN